MTPTDVTRDQYAQAQVMREVLSHIHAAVEVLASPYLKQPESSVLYRDILIEMARDMTGKYHAMLDRFLTFPGETDLDNPSGPDADTDPQTATR